MVNTVEALPTFYNMTYTDKDGNMTADSLFYNDEMFQTLNTLVDGFNVVGDMFNNGLQVPNKTNIEIGVYGGDPNVPDGTIWFSTNDMKLKVKTAAGTIETITSV